MPIGARVRVNTVLACNMVETCTVGLRSFKIGFFVWTMHLISSNNVYIGCVIMVPEVFSVSLF